MIVSAYSNMFSIFFADTTFGMSDCECRYLILNNSSIVETFVKFCFNILLIWNYTLHKSMMDIFLILILAQKQLVISIIMGLNIKPISSEIFPLKCHYWFIIPMRALNWKYLQWNVTIIKTWALTLEIFAIKFTYLYCEINIIIEILVLYYK